VPVIEAVGVAKDYDGVRALEGVSFTVEPGEVFALLGPNGAGKTTLLRLLTSILSSDLGTVRLFGQADLRKQLGRIGYMPEERGLYRQLTPLETVAYFARLKGLSRTQARQGALEALTIVGMQAHARRRLDELSKGMAQRVQFAAALGHAPDLLILDEPFSGLDPVSARDLQAVVLEQARAGRTVLLSTHNMEHAERLCDRLMMLHHGRVCLYGTVAEVKARYTDDSLQVECAGPVPAVAGAMVEPMGERAARLRPDEGRGRREILSALLAAGADVVRFEPVVPTLEEVFVRAAGAGAEQELQQTRAAHEGTAP